MDAIGRSHAIGYYLPRIRMGAGLRAPLPVIADSEIQFSRYSILQNSIERYSI